MKLIIHLNVDLVATEDLDIDPGIIKRSRDGDSFAQLNVGKAYYHATYIQNNCCKAFEWIESSAKQDNMEAQFILGDMFALGHGVDQNILTAHEWYTKSALQDYTKALIRIHNLYQEDKKIHCRGELNSEEEGMNELEFKQKNKVRELNEFRLNSMQSEKLLGNTDNFFSEKFRSLRESKDDDKDAQRILGFLYQHGYGTKKIAKRAIECYTKAADLGHTSAQYNLGLLYQENKDIKFNYRHALKWYTKAANAGSSAAQNHLAFFYEKGLIVEVDFSKALHWYTQSATNNNKGAMLNTARIYRKGLIGGNPNYVEAIKWYIMAARQGSSKAKHCLYQLSQKTDMVNIASKTNYDLWNKKSSIKSRLGSRLRFDVSNMSCSPSHSRLKKLALYALIGDGNAMLEIGLKYFEGRDFTQDKETGFRWLKKAAQSGLIEVQLRVAEMYEKGVSEVIKQDYYEASIWYSMAAKKKDSEAQRKKGILYYQGHGLRKDPLEASKWLTLSSEQGDSDSQYMLGILRQKGEGLTKSSLESYEWFTKSAIQGNPHALYQLGILHIKGKTFTNTIFVKPDLQRALKMFKYAANHNSLDAQLALSKIYEKNDAVEENPAEMFKYCFKAAMLGDIESKYKIGYMYLYGIGAKQDYRNAFRWINEAAKSNHQKAKLLFTVPIKTSDTTIEYYKILEMLKVATLSEGASLEYNIGYLYEKGLGRSSSRNYIRANFSEALDWYKQSEKKNHPKAIYRLGKMYQEGRGVSQDYAIAVHYFSQACELKDIDSLNTLALIYLAGIGIQEDTQKAFCLYLEAANLGCPNARSILALLYETEERERDNGEFLNNRIKRMLLQAATDGNTIMQYQFGIYYQYCRDTDSAIKWFKLSAQNGFIESYYKLGEIYEEQGEHQSYSEAIKMYEAAMEKNHDKAICNLAKLYQYGIGTPCDYEKAFILYNEAAKQGNNIAYKILDITRADTTSKEFKDSLRMCEHVALSGNIDLQYKVGYVYERNVEPPEYNKAYKWYSRAASSFHKESIYRLGLLHKDGLGCSQSWAKAIDYFEKARNLGISEAYFELGIIYHSGNGVDPNLSKAKDYYLNAAELGDSNAQYTLGDLYEKGNIVEEDQLEALKWLTKAYYQENKDAIVHLRFLDDDTGYEKLLLQKEEHIEQAFLKLHKTIEASKDPEYDGHMYLFLGYKYLCRTKTAGSLQKAWLYFNISRKTFKNKEASNIIESLNDVVITSTKVFYYRKFEMFNEMIDYINETMLYEIGVIYYSGKKLDDDISIYAIEPNHVLAFKFFSKSLKKGLLQSHKPLGDMYYYGQGIDADHEKGQQHHLAWADLQSEDVNFQTGRLYYENTTNIDENKRIAFIYINKSLNQKNFDAQDYLNRVFYYDRHTLEYRKKATELHNIFADKQTAIDNMKIGELYLKWAGNNKEIILLATVYLEKASSQGNFEADFFLANIYYNCDYVKDRERAKDIQRNLANQLPSDENFEIGVGYYIGDEFIEKNYTFAIIHLSKAASKGYIEAERFLGDAYYYGNGVEKNPEKGEELHRNLASQLPSDENFDIGVEYYTGAKYSEKNYTFAIIHLSKAANDGYIKANRFLGDAYYYGNGVEKNPEKGEELHINLANQLPSDENFEIGVGYYTGAKYSEKNYTFAIIHLSKAANDGYTEAERFLGDAYYYGDGVVMDLVKAKEFYKSSASQLSPKENFAVSQEYWKGLKNKKTNFPARLIYLNEAASKNHAGAQRYLGDIYYYGYDVEKNEQQGIGFYNSSANLFSCNENYDIGREYYEGFEQTKKNLTIAAIYFAAAADQNNAKSQKYLGDMYYYGEGVEKNEEKAVALYKSSANGLTHFNSFTLGLEYYRVSRNSKKNYTAAFIYFSRASNYNVRAARYLGDMYYYGLGIKENREKAIEIYSSSSSPTDRAEELRIGRKYLRGSLDTEKNYSIAFIYFNKAFEKGSGFAAQHLGDMYLCGNGVGKDHERAVEMFNISATRLLKSECFDVGLEYYEGSENIEKNYTIASIYMTKAFNKGISKAKKYLKEMRL